MSCGCKGKAKASINVFEDKFVPFSPPYQMVHETTECFNARVSQQNPSPEVGSKNPIEHIATQTIPVDCEMKVNTTFKMTEGSHPVIWELELKDDQGNVVQADTLGLTWDASTGVLSGTVKPEYEKKKLSAHVKAKAQEAFDIQDKQTDVPTEQNNVHLNVGDVVDEKEYNYVPKKCEKGDLKFIHPSAGPCRMSSPFGPRVPPVRNATDYHNGCDFASHGQNKIVASADGVVSGYTGVHNGYGNIIEIDHKDASGKLLAKTRYAHLREMYVKKGDAVTAGQIIGHEGHTGRGSGDHLHFEILMGGTTPVNPLDYINGTITIDPVTATGTTVDSDTPSPGTPVVQQNSNKAMTQEEIAVKTDCPPQPAGGDNGPAAAEERAPKPGPVKGGSKCKPEGWVQPPAAQVAREIRDVARANGATDEEIRYMLKIAYLESSYNQYAKADSSTALGLFQMLDGTAGAWFAKIGVDCTCENRCNVEYATKAMVKMVKYEGAGYDSYHRDGTIAGAGSKAPVPNNPFTQNYGSLTREQFMYMSHGQGQSGMRHGTPGGAGFLSHFNSHAPKDSVIDGYMNG